MVSPTISNVVASPLPSSPVAGARNVVRIISPVSSRQNAPRPSTIAPMRVIQSPGTQGVRVVSQPQQVLVQQPRQPSAGQAVSYGGKPYILTVNAAGQQVLTPVQQVPAHRGDQQTIIVRQRPQTAPANSPIVTSISQQPQPRPNI